MGSLFWVVNDTATKKVVLNRVDSPLGLYPVVLINDESDLSKASEQPFSELVTWKGDITGKDKLELAYTAVAADKTATTTINGDATAKATTPFSGTADNVSYAVHAMNAQKGGSAHLDEDGSIIPERAGKVKVWAIVNGERAASAELTIKAIITAKPNPEPFNVGEDDADASRWFTVAPANSPLALSIKTAKPAVATIVGGKLHAVGKGDITVTATAEDGTTKDVTVHVVAPVVTQPVVTPPATKSITAAATKASAKGGDTIALKDMFTLVGLAPADVTFTVDPKSAGDVNAAGALKLKDAASGKVEVTAAATGVTSAKFTITAVTAKASTGTGTGTGGGNTPTITIKGKTPPNDFHVGDTALDVSALFDVTPAGTTTTFSLPTAKPAVATLAGNNLTPVGTGDIIVQGEAGGKTATVTVNVKAKVVAKTLALSGAATATLAIGATLDVATLFTAAGGTPTYSVDSSGHATLAGSTLTGVDGGNTVVTATLAGATGSPKTVTVTVPPAKTVAKKADVTGTLNTAVPIGNLFDLGGGAAPADLTVTATNGGTVAADKTTVTPTASGETLVKAKIGSGTEVSAKITVAAAPTTTPLTGLKFAKTTALTTDLAGKVTIPADGAATIKVNPDPAGAVVGTITVAAKTGDANYQMVDFNHFNVDQTAGTFEVTATSDATVGEKVVLEVKSDDAATTELEVTFS